MYFLYLQINPLFLKKQYQMRHHINPPLEIQQALTSITKQDAKKCPQ